MLRRIVCGTLVCAMAALAGACGGTTFPVTPTGSIVTETFTGTLNASSTNIHQFVTITGGPVITKLTDVGPDATKTIGFSMGTYNPTLNVCTVIFDNPAALPAAVFNATASTTGFYCVRLYDNGTVAGAIADGSATMFTYTVTVTHP